MCEGCKAIHSGYCVPQRPVGAPGGGNEHTWEVRSHFPTSKAALGACPEPAILPGKEDSSSLPHASPLSSTPASTPHLPKPNSFQRRPLEAWVPSDPIWTRPLRSRPVQGGCLPGAGPFPGMVNTPLSVLDRNSARAQTLFLCLQ